MGEQNGDHEQGNFRKGRVAEFTCRHCAKPRQNLQSRAFQFRRVNAEGGLELYPHSFWISGFGLLYLQRKNSQYERKRRLSVFQNRSRCFGEEIKSPAVLRNPTTISRLTSPWSITILTNLSRLSFGRVKRLITKSFVMTPKAWINSIKTIMSAAVPPACWY